MTETPPFWRQTFINRYNFAIGQYTLPCTRGHLFGYLRDKVFAIRSLSGRRNKRSPGLTARASVFML
jgi:hypothetical protein